MPQPKIPPMPAGFDDVSAWQAIHWKFSVDGSILDQAVIGWQIANQERCQAAARAAAQAREDEELDQTIRDLAEVFG